MEEKEEWGRGEEGWELGQRKKKNTNCNSVKELDLQSLDEPWVGTEKLGRLLLRSTESVLALKQELKALTTQVHLVALKSKTPTPGDFAA